MDSGSLNDPIDPAGEPSIGGVQLEEQTAENHWTYDRDLDISERGSGYEEAQV